MREALGEVYGNRLRFRAVVARYGTKPNYRRNSPDTTILLTNIVRIDTDEEVADHIWFTVGTTLAALNLQPGDVVEFDARVGDYVKGYVNDREYVDNRTVDYKLNRPTRFVKNGIPHQKAKEISTLITPTPDQTLVRDYVPNSLRQAGSGRWLIDVLRDGSLRTVFFEDEANA